METVKLHEVNNPEITPVLDVVSDDPRGYEFLPHFDNEVVATHNRDYFECRRGSVTERTVEMADGTYYPVVIGEPSDKKLGSDTAIVMTTAWMTSTDGHNSRTVMRAMDLGYPVIMIGPEGQEANQELSTLQRFKLAATTSQVKIAYDMNRILDNTLPRMDVRQEEIITLGESRGAMLAHGFNIPLYSGDRRVSYFDLTAPCFPQKPSLGEIPAVINQLPKEAVRLGQLALELPFQPRGKHYVGTIHKKPEYYAKEPFKILQLLSGQAGLLERKSRQDTPGHIRIFKGDGWSQKDKWIQAYQKRDTVHIEVAEGLHLDIADCETLGNIALRLKLLRDMRGKDGDFDKVDFATIIKAHKDTPQTRSNEHSDSVLMAA